MKAMVIGLGPEYNYPGKLEIWRKNNTRYASNLGASLISNSLLKQFNADYIDDFSNIEYLKNTYDVCIIAMATHVTSWRDVTEYADIVEKLNMKTVAFSLGVQDYSNKSTDVFKLHPSMKRLLSVVSNTSRWIGVRGPFTASILYQNGFRNVVPIGCPTMYWRLKNDLTIENNELPKKPLIVYHRAFTEGGYHLLKDIPFLGQDYEDHIVFKNDIDDDITLKKWITDDYLRKENGNKILQLIKTNGLFETDFKKWFSIIGRHDFIFGTRLHGCIAGLVQNKPAVLIPRDLRVKEIAEFYEIPTINNADLAHLTIKEIIKRADFTKFNGTYKIRYNNYCQFLEENKMPNNLEYNHLEPMTFTYNDLLKNFEISNLLFKECIEKIDNLNQTIKVTNEKINNVKKEIIYSSPYITANTLYKFLKNIPFASKFAKKQSL